MDYVVNAVMIGAGATAVMDAWMLARKALLRMPLPDYALVGRWIAHMTRGRFAHDRIAASRAMAGERWIGWVSHYLVGIGFAAMLLAIAGLEWARDPTPGAALAFGIATVAAPFLLMQPGMGAGVAASRTPRPGAARLQSIVTHAVFGFGIYAAARVANTFLP